MDVWVCVCVRVLGCVEVEDVRVCVVRVLGCVEVEDVRVCVCVRCMSDVCLVTLYMYIMMTHHINATKDVLST